MDLAYVSLGVPRPVQLISKAHDAIVGVYCFTKLYLIVELQGNKLERKRFVFVLFIFVLSYSLSVLIDILLFTIYSFTIAAMVSIIFWAELAVLRRVGSSIV